MTMNGYEKAAIFLSSVGEDIAAQILKDLEPQAIGKISSYMAKSRKKEWYLKQYGFIKKWGILKKPRKN